MLLCFYYHGHHFPRTRLSEFSQVMLIRPWKCWLPHDVNGWEGGGGGGGFGYHFVIALMELIFIILHSEPGKNTPVGLREILSSLA